MVLRLLNKFCVEGEVSKRKGKEMELSNYNNIGYTGDCGNINGISLMNLWQKYMSESWKKD